MFPNIGARRMYTNYYLQPACRLSYANSHAFNLLCAMFFYYSARRDGSVLRAPGARDLLVVRVSSITQCIAGS